MPINSQLHSGEVQFADRAADIWAIGMILYCMVFGEYPFQGDNKQDIIKNICTKEISFPKKRFCTEELKDLILKMLEKNPEKRIDMLHV